MRNWLRRLRIVRGIFKIRYHLTSIKQRLERVEERLTGTEAHLQSMTGLTGSASTRQIAGAALSEYISHLLASGKYVDLRNLNRYEFGVFSRSGNDGIITEIFRRIGTTSRYFVEIGASNGLENNTTYLLWQGWRGGWVEAGDHEVAHVKSHFRRPLESRQLTLAQSMVTAENIENTLREMDVPAEFDLLSLDIDRNTYWVWKAIRAYKPRVVVVEYNPLIPPPVEWIVEYRADLVWNGTMYYGASLKSFERLGLEMGYHLVGCDLVGADAFFVRKDLCADHFLTPYTAETHYEPSRHFLWPMHGSLHPPGFSDIE